MEIGKIEQLTNERDYSHFLVCDPSLCSHLKDNQFFLDLLKKIWNDDEAINHMSEDVFQELRECAESWGWA